MRIVVGVTDNRWAAFLRDRAAITDVSFWQPSPHGFKALHEGGPLLFKTKRPGASRDIDISGYSLVGGGFFEEYFEMPVSEAWAIWAQGNGVASEQDLVDRVRGISNAQAVGGRS